MTHIPNNSIIVEEYITFMPKKGKASSVKHEDKDFSVGGIQRLVHYEPVQ